MARGKFVRTPEMRARMSAARKGQVPWNTGKKLPFFPHPKAVGRTIWNRGMKYSDEMKARLDMSGLSGTGDVPWNKGRKMPEISREKHPLWNGGSTIKNQQVRKSIEYRQWRTAVFERDDFTCQECGERGVEIHADHIKPFAFYPELRFDLNNGRTLCVPCHKQTDTYLSKAKRA